MNLQNISKNSLFLQSYRITISNYSKIGMMVLFDVMFLVSFFIIQKLSNYLGMNIVPYINFSPITFLFILSAIYYLAVLFLYSFFKFNVLDYAKSIFGKTKFSFKRFLGFFLLNLTIAFIFLILMLIIDYILMSTKPNYAPYVFLVIAIPYLLFLYIILNISQSLFYNGSSLRESLRKGFRITFTEMNSYREIVLAIVLLSIMLWLLFLGFGYLVRISTSGNNLAYLSAYSAFSEIIKWVVSIAAYLLILINRVSFYIVAKDKT